MASPANSIIKALSQKTQMKRAIDLRAAENDNDVKAIIKKMVESAIVAQTSNKPRLMMRSIEELNQTVRDLVTRNISVSEKTKKNMVRKLTNLSDDLTKELESGGGASSGGGGGGLANVLPSFDNITSAIMTASPILGYGARLLQTVSEGASNNNVRNAQRSQQERDGQIRANDILDDDDEDTVSGGGGSVSNSEKYLESILDQLVTLNSIWGDGTTETNNKLSELVRVEEEVKEEQRLLREQNEFDSIEAQRRQDAGGERGGSPSPTGDPESDSMLNSILGGGMGGAIMAAVTGIAGFFGPILAASSTIAGLAAKVAIIPAVIYAIYQFIEGFFNAGEILGLGENEVTISDRIAAGIGSVVDGFLSMINSIVSTVAGWFGMDVDFMPENSKQIISNSIKGMFDFFKGIFNDVLSLFGFGPDQEQSLLDGVKGIAKSVLSIPLALFNMVTGFFGIDAITFEDIGNKVTEDIEYVISKVTGFVSSIFDSIVKFFTDNIPSFEGAGEFLSSIGDSLDSFVGGIKDFAGDTVKSGFNSVKSFLGFGDDEEEKDIKKLSIDQIKSGNYTEKEVEDESGFNSLNSFLGFGDDEEEKDIKKLSIDQIKSGNYTEKEVEDEFKRRKQKIFKEGIYSDSGSTKTAETFSMTNRGMNSTKQKQQQSSAAIVNAPSSTSVSTTIVEGGGGNTANPDIKFRANSSGAYIGAYSQ